MNGSKSTRIQDGVIASIIAITGAIAIRALQTTPGDLLHFQGLEELTGLDFGDWPRIFYSGGGGDGEIFAVLAADPFGAGPSQMILIPVYRFMRIGFSLAAWAVSGGQDGFVLPALFGVGLASVAGVGFLAGYLRAQLGARSWWLLLNPALFIGFAGDSAEPLGILLLTGALVTTSAWSSIALGVVRPTYATALWGRWKLLFGVCVAAVGVRILAVFLFGGSAFESAGGAFALPFTAYFSHPSIPGILLLLAGCITLIRGVAVRDGAWAISGLLVIVLGDAVVDNPMNAMRAAGMIPVLWAMTPWRRSADENPDHPLSLGGTTS